MSEYKVEWVALTNGVHVSAEKLVCPQCNTLDMGTDIDCSTEPAKAICPKCDLEWTFTTKADA